MTQRHDSTLTFETISIFICSKTLQKFKNLTTYCIMFALSLPQDYQYYP